MEAYTIQELYDDLPCSLTELAQKSGLNEVTIARIRDGKPARRSTLNKLLLSFSEVYQRPLTLRNVTGVTIQQPPRVKVKRGKKQKSVA